MSPALRDAHAFWLRTPGVGEIRPVTLPEPGQDDVVVRTVLSGISRGTETLVFRGGVPRNQYAVMRAPFQDGEFPAPVKYGYLNVGTVEHGPAELCGRTVFCLYPHQSAYVVPADAVTVVPDGVPPARAVLAGTVEAAVNALWDAAPLIGDRVTVVGAGMVGCCVARLLSRFPAIEVTLVDVDPARAEVAAALGADFAILSQRQVVRASPSMGDVRSYALAVSGMQTRDERIDSASEIAGAQTIPSGMIHAPNTSLNPV
jgi:threonine dehydrogenase-like Zn-dependent dehydrogenase